MPVQNVYQNIENILMRIDTIKRRFGAVHNPLHGNSGGSFEIKLQEEMSGESNIQKQEPILCDKEPSVVGTPEHKSYIEIIEAASQKYRIPSALIKAVIKQESNFEEKSVSSKGAMGLMQLMPGTADLLGVQNPFDARENIFGGTRYLGDLLNLYKGNLNKALAAYNAGPQKVQKKIPDIAETRSFIDSVLHYYETFSQYRKDGEL